MHVISIVPQAYLSLLNEDKYHMALAHLIGEDGYEEYTSFFQRKARTGNDWIIMDNGLIETGKAMPVEILMRRGLLCCASEIILPDVFRKKQETLGAIEKALDYIANNSWGGTFKYMAVPQGETLEEWVECAKEVLTLPHAMLIHSLGIPKVLVDIAGRDGRLLAIKELFKERPELRIELHLLGCWKTPLEVMGITLAELSKEIPAVRSVDSVIAYTYARKGARFSDSDRPDSDPVDFRWGMLPEKNGQLLERNLQDWRTAGNAAVGIDALRRRIMRYLL